MACVSLCGCRTYVRPTIIDGWRVVRVCVLCSACDYSAHTRGQVEASPIYKLQCLSIFGACGNPGIANGDGRCQGTQIGDTCVENCRGGFHRVNEDAISCELNDAGQVRTHARARARAHACVCETNAPPFSAPLVHAASVCCFCVVRRNGPSFARGGRWR